jgi:hypothetical protein
LRLPRSGAPDAGDFPEDQPGLVACVSPPALADGPEDLGDERVGLDLGQ